MRKIAADQARRDVLRAAPEQLDAVLIVQLDIRPTDPLPRHIQVFVFDEHHLACGRIPRDQRAELLRAREAVVQNRLRAELGNRILVVDAIPVDRQRQTLRDRRLEHDPAGERIRPLRSNGRVAGRELAEGGIAVAEEGIANDHSYTLGVEAFR